MAGGRKEKSLDSSLLYRPPGLEGIQKKGNCSAAKTKGGYRRGSRRPGNSLARQNYRGAGKETQLLGVRIGPAAIGLGEIWGV